MSLSKSQIENIRETLAKARKLQTEGNLTEAISTYQSILEVDPNNVSALHQVAQICEARGDFSEAIEHYQKAIDLDPEPPFWVYRHLGFALNQQSRWEEAVVAYQSAIAKEPSDTATYSLLGQTLDQQGNFKEAILNYQKAIEVSGNAPIWVYLNLGAALSQCDRVTEAIEAYEAAQKLDPQNSGIHRLLKAEIERREANKPDCWQRAQQLQAVGKLEEALTEYREVLQNDNCHLAALHQVAQICEGQGKFAEAIASYQKAIEIDGDPPFWVYRHLGFALSQEGQLGEAIQAYQKAIAIAPNDADAYSLLGQTQGKKGEFEEAIASYRKAIELNPKPPFWLYLNLGEALNGLGELEEAIVAYREAAKLDPDNVGIQRLLEKTLYGAGNESDPETDLKLAERLHQDGDFERALQKYQAALEREGDRVAIWHQIAKLYEMKGDIEAAIASYRQAIALDSESPFWVYRHLGFALCQKGEIEEAIAVYEKALELKPDDAATYSLLGKAQALKGEDEATIAAYRQASTYYRQEIERQPQDREVWKQFVDALVSQQQIDEAIAICRKALNFNSSWGEFYATLGKILLQHKGERDEAIVCFRKSLEFDREDPWTYCHLAIALFQQGLVDEAIAELREAIRHDPNFYLPYHLIGEWRIKQSLQGEQLDDAIICLRKAIDLNPDSFKSYYCLGYALTQQKQFEEAVRCYRRSLELEPTFFGAYHQLGHALAELGKPDEASQYYLKALELNPSFAWSDHNLGHITIDPEAVLYPLWDGSPLSGRRILVEVGQELGEAIRLIRYVPALAEMGGRVVLKTPFSIARLFSQIAGVESVEIEGMTPPDYDLRVPLLSLPYLTGARANAVAYLREEPTQYQLIPAMGNQLKVGIVWGSDRISKDNACPLSLFINLLSGLGIQGYSLQTGVYASELQLLKGKTTLVNCDNHLNDLAEEAALITQLDLILAVDSVAVHLAGALGRPVWTLLPVDADSRWFLASDTSAEYHSMRVFRQHQIGCWESVFDRVRAALQDEFSDRLSPSESGLSQAIAYRIDREDLTRQTWEFNRVDGTTIATICLRPNGLIEGIDSANEVRWNLEDGKLVFYTEEGQPSTRFHSCLKNNDRFLITGHFLLGGNLIHSLQSCQSLSKLSLEDLTSKNWDFKRLNGSKIATVQLVPNGQIRGVQSSNEYRWGREGDCLIFYTDRGQPSTRFDVAIESQGRWTLTGQFLLGGQVTHVLEECREIIREISREELIGKNWRFGRSDGSKIAMVKLLPNGEIEGIRSSNEFRWHWDGKFLLFYTDRGQVSTRFSSAIEDDGKLVLTGLFLLEPWGIHILQEC